MKFFDFSWVRTGRIRKKSHLGIRYLVAFEPTGLSRDQRIKGMKKFKDFFTSFRTANDMLHEAIDFLNDFFPVDENVDVVLFAPSTSNALRVCAGRFEQMFKAKVYRDAFAKNKMVDIQLRTDILNRECAKSQKEIPQYFENVKRAHKNDDAKVSYISSSRRRYIKNLVRLTIDPELLKGKRVLVVDDTIGEGVTFHNIHEVLKEAGVENEMYFAVMRDFTQTTA
jgi:hypothetical protein